MEILSLVFQNKKSGSHVSDIPRMPSISRRKLIKKLRYLGFEGPLSGTRHSFMKKGSLKVRIPNKHEGDISSGLLSQILRQAGIAKKDW